ncbi:ParA family protein [uncultured Pseudokineococcus sp.]|uniref:ParA family protein n=1 Tax=uncultured Pseudokineococcus sp. TaxID=1642928 RepID=UPI0026239EA4|nr:ParA family protein [uncultured Pseudokineococcus sp.]
MKSIAFFNNKGGVGKTTLICNLAHYLAKHQGLRVALMDLDPQCNSTQLLLAPELCKALYWPDGDDLYGGMDGSPTIYDAVRPLEEGEGAAASTAPSPRGMNRFDVDIFPGHPRMSVFEDQLGTWFKDATSGDVAGLRKTLWLRQLLEGASQHYDVMLFDLGPSLGALNRSVLAAVDFFVTPMGADIFSVVALRNIAEWMSHWIGLYQQGVALCEKNNPGAAARYGLTENLSVTDGFGGYTVQQYSTVSIRGERRATQAYDQIINQIPSQVEDHLAKYVSDDVRASGLHLGDIPNLRSLVPLAQSANSPLSELTNRDGLTGGQYSQQRNYESIINQVGQRLYQNCING